MHHQGLDFPGQPFLGALAAAFAARPELDEILFNGPRSPALGVIGGRYESSHAVMAPLLDFFPTPVSVLDWLQDLATACFSRIDPFSPSAGGNLPGVSARWHALFPPVVRDGPLLCVRRHRFDSLSLDDFQWQSCHREKVERAVLDGATLLVSGACGAGKSTFVGAVLGELLGGRRMVIIETYEELAGISPHFINLTARPPNLSGAGGIDASWLFREALRIRPDGIVIGEIRGEEAGSFIAAAASGHAACLSTIHAGSPGEAVSRLLGLAGNSSNATGFHGLVVQLAQPPGLARPAVLGIEGFGRLRP